MSISAISNYSRLSTTALARVGSPSKAWQNPGDTQSTTTTTGVAGSSRFATAISDAFAKLGISIDPTSGSVSSTASTTDTSATSGTDDAVGAFLQSLFAALHSQSAGSASPPPSGDDASTAPASTTTDATTAAGSTTSDASSPATLEKTFDTLLSRSGSASTPSASLSSFLQTLAQGPHGAPATGNVVTTSACAR